MKRTVEKEKQKYLRRIFVDVVNGLERFLLSGLIRRIFSKMMEMRLICLFLRMRGITSHLWKLSLNLLRSLL
jgi:hypothetical protein